jgi:hypothetical protein
VSPLAKATNEGTTMSDPPCPGCDDQTSYGDGLLCASCRTALEKKAAMAEEALRPSKEVADEVWALIESVGRAASVIEADRDAVRADEQKRCIEVMIGIIEKVRRETDGYMVDEGADAGEEGIDALNEAIEAIRKGEG